MEEEEEEEEEERVDEVQRVRLKKVGDVGAAVLRLRPLPVTKDLLL